MKVKLIPAPWTEPKITKEAIEAIKIVGDNVWRDAAINFYAMRDAKIKSGKTAPKGMQKFLNEILDRRFMKNEWEGGLGYFFKNQTWIRFTFRHQMSLGSDIIDAIKVCKKEGMELAIILAASNQTLKLISPNDATAMISFEKLQREVFSLDGAIDIPLVIGELIPVTKASKEIMSELLKERSRDTTIPKY